ncbi:MAG: acyl carrier protein [Flavobacteriales bacterium]|nr:acyl carrier protein [Flavobacteriales bacterium]
MEEKIIEIIREISGKQSFKLDDNLINILGFNSKNVMQLIIRLENEFDISIDEEDLDIDNFNNVERIKGLITRYRN